MTFDGVRDVEDFEMVKEMPPQPRHSLGALVMPGMYLLLGLLLGCMVSGVSLSPSTRQLPMGPVRWTRAPWRWLRQEPRVTYDASQVEKFVNLRQRIDQEFNAKLNGVEASAAEFDPFAFSLELLDQISLGFDQFLQDEAIADEAGEEDLDFTAAPTFDVEETEAFLSIKCHMAGVSPEQMRAELQGQFLTISIDLIQEDEATQEERRFSRVFIVPEGVAAEDVVATRDAETLHVMVPKPQAQPPAPEPEPIAIQNAEL